MKKHASLSLILLLMFVGNSWLAADYPYRRGELRDVQKEFAPILNSPDAAAQLTAYLRATEDQVLLDKSLVALVETAGKKKQWALLEEVVDTLTASNDTASTILAAEIMLRLVDRSKAGRLGGPVDTDDLPDSLMDRAAALLDYPDPVVRGIAEWTLSLRVGKQDMGAGFLRKMFEPGPTSAAWYEKWRAVPVERRLAYDYARQLAHLNRHRTLAGVAAEIEAVNERLGAMMREDASDGEASLAAATTYRTAERDAREAVAGGNLEVAHMAYLNLRKAARAVIESARAEFPAEGFVFYTSYEVTGGYWNVNIPARHTNKPGGDIWIKRNADPAESAIPLVAEKMSTPGSVRGIDLTWESDRVLFSWYHQPYSDAYPHGWDRAGSASLYALDLDSGEIDRLTDHLSFDDIEPCWLPDGGVMFASNRSGFGNQCSGAFHQTKVCTTLFRLDESRADEPIAISNNKDFDRFPHVNNDGTVSFMHWEYQERGFYNQHTVWRARPDGTNMDALYKQHINAPMSIRDARQIPDSPLFVGTAQGHHDGHQGPVILFDPSQGINNEEAMWSLTLDCTPIEGGLGPLENQIVAEGGVANRGGTYINPFPMSEQAFVVSHEMTGDVTNYGIYYIDVWGNRELLHREPSTSSFEPMPLRQRARPPVIPNTVDPGADHATVFVENVYRDLPGVEPGAVKYLRISQRLMLPAPEYEYDGDDQFNHLHWFPGGSTGRHFSYWTWAPTRTVGLVEVEEDGSAFFKVPAAMPIFLQALDEDYLEVRRMRSSFTLQRGEFRSCIGCHESRLETAGSRPNYPVGTFQRGPQQPEPPSWGDRTVLDYEQHIQPILDQHCVSCHGQDKPEGGLEFTARHIGGYMQSYRTMFGLGPDQGNPLKGGGGSINNEVKILQALEPGLDLSELNTDKDQAKDMIRDMQAGTFPGMLVSISDRHSNADITMPYAFGSTQSKLIQTLMNDPEHRDDVKANMTEEEWLKLVTWIDHNAVYHSTVIDKSDFGRDQDGPLYRVEFNLPSPWTPADTMPSFYNSAQTEVNTPHAVD